MITFHPDAGDPRSLSALSIHISPNRARIPCRSPTPVQVPGRARKSGCPTPACPTRIAVAAVITSSLGASPGPVSVPNSLRAM